MTGVPLRLRLTAVFALAMATILAGGCFLLYHHLGASLDSTVAQGLRARAADVAALVRQADTGLRASPRAEAGFAQVLTAHGHVFDGSPGLGTTPLLTQAQLAEAQKHPVLIQRLQRGDESVRLLATPVTAQGQKLVVVVGAPLEQHDEALATLRDELLVGAPVALLLASLLGYLIAAAALRPALARERRFVADASHELRTPLAHLRAEVELALESPHERDELEAALRSVGVEADRLSQVAADLLLLARIHEGRLPIRREDVDLAELLDGIAARFARRAHEAARSIVTTASGTAYVDRLRIEQALGNLVENSLRYGAGSIRISAARHADRLELRVDDDGPGFPAEFAPHAFERFTRADDSRSTGGAGLGLAIVAAVAEAHGGSAAVAGAGVAIRVVSPGRRPRVAPVDDRTAAAARDH